MKNLTIKKVALGVFLAGYAASSAFAALDPAISNNVIYGNAPIFTNTGVNNSPIKDNTVSVQIYTDDSGTDAKLVPDTQKVKVGDYVFIRFKLKDSDADDIDTVANILKKTVRVIYTKEKNPFNQASPSAWLQKDAINSGATGLDSYSASFDKANLKGEIKFKLDALFTGAQKIGFTLLERTQYGLPYTNNYLMVTDITSDKGPKLKPSLTNGQDPKAPTVALPDPETDIGHEEHGPGDKANGGFPIEGSTTRIGIFKYDSSDKLIINDANYTQEKDKDDHVLIPHYGDKFGAVVWVDDGGTPPVVDNSDNHVVDEGELQLTSSYEFTWYLSGDYTSPADPVTNQTTTVASDPTVELNVNVSDKDGTHDTIALGDTTAAGPNVVINNNSKYASIKGLNSTDLLAGIQGYKLKVSAK